MEQASVSLPEVALRCRVSDETVAEWLTGEDLPTKTQFKHLTSLLRRPSAFFFLREPPAKAAVKAAFRHPPGEDEMRDISRDEANAIRRARRLQQVSEWILTSSGSSPLRMPIATIEDTPDAVADVARKFFLWSSTEQYSASSISAASRALRDRLENFGLIVLHLPLAQKGCRGFSLSSEYAPVIAINTAYAIGARIFSYGHELAHLILQQDNICANRSDYRLERWCDRFSAALLMPKTDVREFVENQLLSAERGTLKSAQRVASHFKVSLSAAAIRLIDLSFEPPNYYYMIDQGDLKPPGGGAGGETSPEKRYREWGSTYPQLLLAAEERNLLTRQDVLEYLNLSNSQLTTLRELLTTGPREPGG
jgi:Zn-dependent peptidase ImmA (M78 family)